MAVKKVQKPNGKAGWRVRVKIDGKLKTKFFDRMAEAKAFEYELRNQKETPSGCPTLKEFEPRFIRHQKTLNKASVVFYKEETLRLHILPEFGDTPLDKIDTDAIDTWRGKQFAKGLSPATVGNHLGILRRVLKVAQRWKLIQEVPVFDMPVPEEKVFDFLRFEEANKVLATAPERWHRWILFGVRTGLRCGEMRALHWSDVDLERRTIRVCRSYTRHGWSTPKSGKTRYVPIPLDLAESMASWPRSCELVFSTASGKPVQYKTIYNNVTKATLGLGRELSPHDLRHTFASHHAMLGTDLVQIRDWLGHSTIKMTEIYAHLCPSASLQRADVICRPVSFPVSAPEPNVAKLHVVSQ